MNGLNNEINEGNPKTVVEEKFSARKENLLEMKKKQLEQKKGDLKNNYLTKEFLKDEFYRKCINTGPNGLITLMLGKEKEKDEYAQANSMRIKEEEIDSRCSELRIQIRFLREDIDSFLKKNRYLKSFKNKQYNFKINSMDLNFNGLLELINYIENLRKVALRKYHTFTKKIEEEVGVSRAQLNSSEYNNKMDEYNFKRIRIYGVRFKNEFSKILEKERQFLKKISETAVYVKELDKRTQIEEEKIKEALEKDIDYAVNYRARNVISSYEHLLYAIPLDEVAEETKKEKNDVNKKETTERTEELNKLLKECGVHYFFGDEYFYQ